MNNGYDYNEQNNNEQNNNEQNNNEQNNNEQNNSGKEEIRFDDWEMRNPYSSGAYSSNGGRSYNDKNQGGGEFDYGSYDQRSSVALIDEAQEKRKFSRIGFGYALFTLISTVAALLIQIITINVAPEFYETSLFLNLVSPVALYIFALPALLVLLSGVEAKSPEKKSMSIGQWLLFLLVGFGVMYIGAMIGNTVMEYFSQIMNYDYSNALESIVDEENIWVTAIFTVIVAPIGEEFVFRKLLIDRTQKYGGAVCVLISGITFGLMHGNIAQCLYATVIGLILGYVAVKTNGIRYTVLIHIVINTYNMALAWGETVIFNTGSEMLLTTYSLAILLNMAVLIIGGVIVMVKYAGIWKKQMQYHKK